MQKSIHMNVRKVLERFPFGRNFESDLEWRGNYFTWLLFSRHFNGLKQWHHALFQWDGLVWEVWAPFGFFLNIFWSTFRMIVIFLRLRRAMLVEAFRYLEHLHTVPENFSRATLQKKIIFFEVESFFSSRSRKIFRCHMKIFKVSKCFY